MIKLTVKENFKPLEDLVRRARELEGQRSVSVTALLTPEFLSSCSRFASADEMFAASGFRIESAEDFNAIPDAEWDGFHQQQYFVFGLEKNVTSRLWRMGETATWSLNRGFRLRPNRGRS